MKAIGVVAEEVLVEHQPAAVGNGNGVHQRSARRGGVGRGHAAHQPGQERLVHSRCGGAGDAPPVPRGKRPAIDIWRAGGKRQGIGDTGRIRAREAQCHAQRRPGKLDQTPLRIVAPGKSLGGIRGIDEADGLAMHLEQEARCTSALVALRIAKEGRGGSIGLRREEEEQVIAVLFRIDPPAPERRRFLAQADRERVRHSRHHAGRLDPEALDGVALRRRRAQLALPAGKDQVDPVAAHHGRRLEARDLAAPSLAAPRQRQGAARPRAEDGVRFPDTGRWARRPGGGKRKGHPDGCGGNRVPGQSEVASHRASSGGSSGGPNPALHRAAADSGSRLRIFTPG